MKAEIGKATMHASETVSQRAWRKEVGELMLQFARGTPEFMGEDAKQYCLERIHPAHDPRVWGYLFRETLIRPGHVAIIGTEKSKLRRAHGRRNPYYKSLLFKGELGANVSAKEKLGQIMVQILDKKISVKDGVMQAYQLGLTDKKE